MDNLNAHVRSFLYQNNARFGMHAIAALMSYVLFKEKLDSMPQYTHRNVPIANLAGSLPVS